ncbi:MAG TPA: dihydrolipoamide acetyltransferase family protein [Anaerolineaceae bacterium]|nr:dihydrolipoamide acetyltransferase family protein [Anaerolineaceae bacterium]
MAETVNMPKLGFDMAEGTLVRWVKAEGEAVSKGEILAEIETDKATVEVESPYSGVVQQQLVEQGAVVPVGSPIAIVTAPGETLAESKDWKTEPMPTGTPKESAEAKVKPKPETNGGVKQAGKNGPAAQPAQTPQQPPAEGEMPHASPLARKMARDQGLDLSTVHGSGPGGRVVRKDVEAALAAPAAARTAPAPVVAPAGPAAPVPEPQKASTVLPAPAWISTTAFPEDEIVPLERLRSAIGRRMVEAKQQVPHFYVTHEYDMAAVMSLRKQVNEHLPEDQKLSVNDFIIKATALTLRQFPNLNASLKGDQIVRHGHINIGVAVAVDAGLLTVVNRDSDRKPLRQISAEVREMVKRARSGKVRPEDIEGSTFSISNLGMYDVEDFVAIINPPEAAILAVGSVKQVPVVVDGELRVGSRMRMTLSADHRITDGAEAARFLQALAPFLETPVLLLV